MKTEPNVLPLTDSVCKDRQRERAVCRLRIGHTGLTHGFLMARQPPPLSEDCGVQVTVPHVLMECTKYTQQRRTLAGVKFKKPINNHMRKHGLVYNFMTSAVILNLL